MPFASGLPVPYSFAHETFGDKTPAMIDFQPTEEQCLVRDAVADLSRTTLRARLRDHEELRGLPEDVRRTMSDMGLGAAMLPEALGGQGFGLVAAVLIEEELAHGDPAAAFACPGPGAYGRAILELGSAEQQARWLSGFGMEAPDAWSRTGAVAWSEPKPNRERPGFVTVARPAGDHFTITGRKVFTQNADTADRFVVFAQVDDEAGWGGIGAFVVAKGEGVRVGARHETLGLDAASFGEVTFENARAERLLTDGDFTLAALRFFLKQGLLVGARAVGLSRAAFEISREYCDGRKAFGKPIGHFQAVAFKLADRLMDVDGARWMIWRAAAAWDSDVAPRECLRLSAQAIAHALEGAMRCGDDAVQLHGGAGFMRDYPVEKLMRDAKQIGLTCPTVTALDQLAAAVALGVPLDPALVLPTPDIQAIFTLREARHDHRIHAQQEAAGPPRGDREHGPVRRSPSSPLVGPRQARTGRVSRPLPGDGQRRHRCR